MSAFLYTACESSNEVISPEQEPVIVGELFEKNEYNSDMKDFALAVSDAMKKSKDFRNLIKQEALVQFDGDYDVLLSRIMDKPVQVENETGFLRSGEEYTVADLLDDYYSSTDQTSFRAASSTVSELSQKYPLLQVSVPVNADKLDENIIPTVVFIPDDFQDGIDKWLPGYNPDGGLMMVDAVNLPKEAIIVISENERVYMWKPSDPWRPLTPYVSIDLNESETLPDNTVPPAPTDLKASQTSSGIELNWKEPSETMDCHTIGYYIYRKSYSDIDYILITSNNGILNTNYFDKTTESGKSYSYYVTAYNSLGESSRSNVISTVGPGRPASILSFEVKQNNSKEIELQWTTDNNQYIQKTRLYKAQATYNNTQYQLLTELGANEYRYFDRSFSAGSILKYQIQIVTPTGLSNPKTDFIQTSYRNPLMYSPVRIKKIKCNSKLESWSRGSPEFCIKVLGVNSKDKTKSYEIQSEIYIAFKGGIFGWDKEQSFNVLVVNWKPDIWYDVLTFFVVEDDHNKKWELSYNAKLYYKNDLGDGLNVDSSLESKYNFSHEGEKVGYGYLDYFEKPEKWIEFPNYEFKMYIQ